MKDYQERVRSEANQLEKKLNDLENFIGSETFNSLDDRSRIYLLEQRIYMSGYLNVIRLRLKHFTELNKMAEEQGVLE